MNKKVMDVLINVTGVFLILLNRKPFATAIYLFLLAYYNFVLRDEV